MDTTDTIASECTLSSWSGTDEECRRCGRTLTGRSRKYCTKRCARIWSQNHFYRRARSECKRLSRIKCGCPRVRSHPACANCGTCEGKLLSIGSWLECNHKVARNGIPINDIGCHHHQDVLEMLCHECHLDVSRQQRLDRKNAALRAGTPSRARRNTRTRRKTRRNPDNYP